MASTSNTTTASDSTIGAIIHADTVQIRDIIVNRNVKKELEKKFPLPRTIDNFYGRQEEFDELDRLFFSEKKLKIVIHGLPGYGKTEITKQYAKYCLDYKKVDKVFWLEMEDIDKLKDLSKDLKQIYEEYKDKRCMFVLDNSLNRQSIFECEPVGNDKHLFLITSHEAEWGPDIVALPLGTLALPSTVEVIRTILNEFYREEDRASYEALAAAVYCVPLGVQVAAAYVRKEIKCLEHRFDFTKYIERIQRQDFINKKIPRNISNPYEKSIYGALAISLNKIKDQNDNESVLALNILYFCAFFSPECIHNKLLLRIRTIKALIGNNSSESEIESELRLTIGVLINYSFVKYGGRDKDHINIHRLTQSCVRHYLSEHKLLDKCYYECLHAVFNVGVYYEHRNSVMSYADDNTSVVSQFVKNNKNKVEDILEALGRCGCSESIKAILKNHSRELDFGISPEIKNELLITAAERGHLKLIQMLVDCEADVNYQDDQNVTPSYLFICYICSIKPNISTQELNETLELLNYKQHIMQVIDTRYGRSSLHWAARAANKYLITLLTDAGDAEIVNKHDVHGNTPLHALIWGLEADSNKEEIVRIVRKLKAYGARVDIKNIIQKTPLEMLLRRSKQKGYDCEYLIEHLTDTESEADKRENNEVIGPLTKKHRSY